jgi:hypothetical protein
LVLVFFMNQFSPKPLSIPLGPFRSSRLTTGINDTGGKFCHQLH